MLDALPDDTRALLALAALAALPGLLVVRAPGRAVPLLSLAFWVLSWPWFAGASRTRFLQSALAVFAALAFFRLLRLDRPRRPRPEHGLLAAGALALFVPFALWPVAPGSAMPRESLAALMLSWHDAWPPSFEPLLATRPFQAGGVASLAADVSLLSGAPAYRATLLATLAGQAALLMALWGLAALSLAPLPAAAIALALTLAAAPPRAGAGALATALAA
ncbi:MAG TPA: hypothetical protein VMR21_09825, partial [Vicinamibacteria bacterium]|nr:hypothetical protein [Vicinamibacteria bacterium]